MKASFLFTVALLLLTLNAQAQNDTMYFVKKGLVINQQAIKEAALDSVVFYESEIKPLLTFTDARDGNVYKISPIGGQVWMAENLRYLPAVVGPEKESKISSYYYVYGYEGIDVSEAKATENYKAYGVLYNWTAAMAGKVASDKNPSEVQGACPAGWHLPSRAEWTQLRDFLGGLNLVEGILKEAGTIHWAKTNAAITNEFNFTALPGGQRTMDGKFEEINSHGQWWTTNEDKPDINYAYLLHFWSGSNTMNGLWVGKDSGISVRCVKN